MKNRQKLTFSEVELQSLFGHEAAEDEDLERLLKYYFKSSTYDQVVNDLALRILVGHKQGQGSSLTFQHPCDLNNRINITRENCATKTKYFPVRKARNLSGWLLHSSLFSINFQPFQTKLDVARAVYQFLSKSIPVLVKQHDQFVVGDVSQRDADKAGRFPCQKMAVSESAVFGDQYTVGFIDVIGDNRASTPRVRRNVTRR